jgi:hypothetical protein
MQEHAIDVIIHAAQYIDAFRNGRSIFHEIPTSCCIQSQNGEDISRPLLQMNTFARLSPMRKFSEVWWPCVCLRRRSTESFHNQIGVSCLSVIFCWSEVTSATHWSTLTARSFRIIYSQKKLQQHAVEGISSEPEVVCAFDSRSSSYRELSILLSSKVHCMPWSRQLSLV